MTEKTPSQIIGARVKHYRTRLDLSQTDLARAIGVNSAQIISQIESGVRELTARELARAAKALTTSVANLLTDSEPDLPTARWRDRPQKNFKEVEARLCLRCERFALLEEWCGERTYRPLPVVSLQKGLLPRIGEILRVAQEIRNAMELGGRPASSLKDVLEEGYGIRIFHDSFDGTALCVSGQFGKAILLNRDNVRSRRNFSLAHELFHLLVEGIYPGGAGEDEERHAQVFASALLLPSESISAALGGKAKDGKIHVRELVAAAQEFHVSTEAMLWRLCNLGNMSKETVKSILANENLKSFEIRGLRITDAPDDLPERFTRLAYTAYDRGRLGLNKLAEFLEVKVEQLHFNSEDWTSDVALDEEAEVTFA